MKRQRNTQQVKEQNKCPPNQTKEEEIGNLPEKEFHIIIVKMIQNLKVKMESQKNSLETRIEKMQERFNKNIEELKKSQYIMNNAINEMKNTLEGITKIMASGPITSREIDGETVETVSDFFFFFSKITADGDCSHEIKTRLLLGGKVMTSLDSIFKSRDITLPTKVRLIKAMVFPVVMYECESWTVKKVERRRIDAFELWCWEDS